MPMDFAMTPAEPTPEAERRRLLMDPGFGRVFTDNMVTIRWTRDRGWHDARLGPYGPLALDPSAQVFHYGQEVFEGLKAFRRPDGSVVTFRPHANAERFNRSCQRMAMPQLPEETFVGALEALVGTDGDWVPEQPGHSLYLRPFMIATQCSLGVYHPSDEYLFVVIASPSGAYFKGGVEPVSVWLSTEHTRAAPGGTGAAKCGGNYAGTFLEQEEAVRHGCDQVVWLDALERRWVEEMGSSNIFFVYGSRLVTPELTGTVLAGVNRASVLRLAGALGYTAAEGRISVDQWRADAASGALTEVFASGTSAMITPIGRVRAADAEWPVGDGRPGQVTLRIREELMGIQYGDRPDPYGWVHKIA